MNDIKEQLIAAINELTAAKIKLVELRASMEAFDSAVQEVYNKFNTLYFTLESQVEELEKSVGALKDKARKKGIIVDNYASVENPLSKIHRPK